jgi:hypothetical protein
VAFNLSFCLELEHYLNDNKATELALSRIKPRDPGLFRVWRYKTALTLKRFPMHLDAVPLDEWASPEDLQDAERSVSSILTAPLSRFKNTRRRYVGGGYAAGAWAAELCYDGQNGLTVDSLDPRCVRWEDGFLEPHHPRNPWVITLRRMPLQQVKKRKNWKVPADLKPDDAHLTSSGTWMWPDPGSRTDRHESSGRLVTVATYRCRFEDYGRKQTDSEPVPLDPALWHLACPGCGWRSPPQSEAMAPYPNYVEGGCPKCGDTIGLVKRVPNPPRAHDKQMVICAPFSGHDEPFYEGPWDFDYPTFPVLFFESYVMPHRAGGQSDTQVLKTPVLASNAMLRLTYETALRSRPYFFMKRDSIENARGGVFAFDPDADGDVMYSKDEIPRPPTVVQGLAPQPVLLSIYDRLQSVFRTNESTSELALTPSEIKDAKVGTVEQVTETGNVVIDDHGEILYDQESLLATCIAAAQRELPSRRQKYQDQNGRWQFRDLGGPLMPRVEIRVGSGQLLDTLDIDELEAYMRLSSLPPELRRGYARFAHISPEVIGQMEADQQTLGPMQPGVPPGAGGAPPIQPPMVNAGRM